MLGEFLLFGALLLASGFFSSAESAMLSLNRVRLKEQAARGDAGARRLLELLRDPKRLLGTILVGNNLANVATASVATMIVWRLVTDAATATGEAPPGDSTLILITTGVTATLLLIFGEMTPKGLALSAPERLARIVAPVLRVLNVALFPVVWSLSGVSRLLDRWLGADPTGGQAVSRGDVLATVAVGQREGALSGVEAEMLGRVLAFGDRRVKDVMTPRTDVVALADTQNAAEALALFREDQYARMPVYGESRDTVVGVLHVKDLLSLNPGAFEDTPVTALMRPARFTPELARIPRLLREMQQERQHLVIAVDEYGGTAGLVTLEDLLEEIVGEILDEFDVEPPLIRRVGARAWLVHGTAPLREVEEALGVPFPEDENAQTLAGFIMARLGRIPKAADTLTHADLELTVRALSEQRVRRVLVVRHRLPSGVTTLSPSERRALDPQALAEPEPEQGTAGHPR